MDHIKNIIFDLGGVILDIDVLKGIKAMEQLGIHDFESAKNRFNRTETFLDFEKGLISETEFLKRLKEAYEVDFHDEDFIAAWNEIIVGFPSERIDLMINMKNSPAFRTFLLSNTNAFHKKVYTRILQEQYAIDGLEDLFEKTYFSHEIHMRKPDTEIYHYVLNDGGMVPEETLFIDDSEVNIETAREMGMETFHLADGITINDLFSERQATRRI
ncbi:MAG: HAD family phosphatase [Bacteroidales bacterium]|nr:HAD family phosphatase [Bacteroidales bacterium]